MITVEHLSKKYIENGIETNILKDEIVTLIKVKSFPSLVLPEAERAHCFVV